MLVVKSFISFVENKKKENLLNRRKEDANIMKVFSSVGDLVRGL